VFGNVVKMTKILLEELRILGIIEEGKTLGAEESLNKTEIVSKLERTILMEEVSCRQKSRNLFLKEGDKSKKFFHRMANSNRRRKYIDSLLIGGTISTNSRRSTSIVSSFIKVVHQAAQLEA
jgi:hypothetical protein